MHTHGAARQRKRLPLETGADGRHGPHANGPRTIALYYGENDDPAKTTYSFFAFFQRDPSSLSLSAKSTQSIGTEL